MNEIENKKINLPKIHSKNEDERISAILIPDKPFEIEEDGDFVDLPEASLEMLTRYHNFLQNKLPAGLNMTGQGPLGYFAWEERFAWGHGNEKDYKALKEKYASCNDKFKFIRLKSLSEELGIMAELKRLSDKKTICNPSCRFKSI
ncbi:MAG TPA: hypothetical protein VMU83_23450 [Hanamia sp.]|nr:hypothetical protein [Hanamia sp.]